MDITCISDMHGDHPELPGGDLLIVAGDHTARDEQLEWVTFFDWLKSQAYRKIVYIAGNHDVRKMKVPTAEQMRKRNGSIENAHIEYLCDNSVEFEGLKIYGSPWTLRFNGINPHCAAFTLRTAIELREKWDMIPDDTDILVTHGPPKGVLDLSMHRERFGCFNLLDRVRKLPNLKLHIFGHIHEGYGQTNQYQSEWREPETMKHLSINCAHMNWNYSPENPAITVTL